MRNDCSEIGFVSGHRFSGAAEHFFNRPFRGCDTWSVTSYYEIDERPTIRILRLTSPDPTNRLTHACVKGLTHAIRELTSDPRPLITFSPGAFLSAIVVGPLSSIQQCLRQLILGITPGICFLDNPSIQCIRLAPAHCIDQQ